MLVGVSRLGGDDPSAAGDSPLGRSRPTLRGAMACIISRRNACDLPRSLDSPGRARNRIRLAARGTRRSLGLRHLGSAGLEATLAHRSRDCRARNCMGLMALRPWFLLYFIVVCNRMSRRGCWLGNVCCRSYSSVAQSRRETSQRQTRFDQPSVCAVKALANYGEIA